MTNSNSRPLKVYTAEPYNSTELGSLGRASGMYIRQLDFPDTYADDERLMSADHDRCMGWDHAHASRCFKDHTGTGEMGFGQWAQQAPHEKVMAFIKDILKVADDATWTGYRVLGSVNRSSGYAVWTLQLFARDPNGSTKVYTGAQAPNVKRQFRNGWAGTYDRRFDDE